MSRRCRSIALGLLLSATLLAPASAQTVILPQTAALACMTPPPDQRGKPEYDEELVRAKIGGTVAVELTFAAPDAPPAVRVTSPLTSEALEQSVRRHVRSYRVPCLAPGAEPVRVQIEYVFVPNDGRKVAVSAPRDAAEARQRELRACLSRIVGPERPHYPLGARQLDLQGTVIVRLHFTSPTEPPRASRVAAPRGDRWLWPEIESFAAGYRLPCLGAEPFTMDMVFRFELNGADRTVIRDGTLLELLRGAASFGQPAYFDLDTLGCPFDVRIGYYQPHKPNRVVELEHSRPERRAFLDWLATVRLKMTRDQEERVLGDAFTVRVPCGKVDL